MPFATPAVIREVLTTTRTRAVDRCSPDPARELSRRASA